MSHSGPRPPIVLSTLIPVVLQGCLWIPCGAFDYEADVPIVVSVPEASLGLHTDAFGILTSAGCDSLCREGSGDELVAVHGCEPVGPDDAGAIDVACSVRMVQDGICIGGRRHEDVALNGAAHHDATSVGAWFARAAEEEAASVGAFRRLARELTRHHAPTSLIERAREAARDEIRHARSMRRHADRSVRSPTFAPEAPRSLHALAEENAAEGCVRETFAALVAHVQARAAAPELRPLFARVAQDETRHGQWSWDLDAWARTQLSPGEIASIDDAREHAIQTLIRDMPQTSAPVRRQLGIPERRTAQRLASALFYSDRT